MITALLVAVLGLTFLVAAMLPFGGWSSNADAAGRGMAIFVPAVFIGTRLLCFAVAIIIMVWGEGLLAIPLSIGAIAALAGLEASAVVACAYLCLNPSGPGRTLYAFLAVIVAPVMAVIWLFTELHAEDAGQIWFVRALMILAAAGPLLILWSIMALEAIESAEARERDAAEEARSRALADVLPPSAPLLEALQYHDRLPETERRAREMILDAIRQRPNAREAFLRLLGSDKWDHRILAGAHAELIPSVADDGYCALVRPTIEEIIRRLRERVTDDETALREAAAAIRLAWPAMHNTGLPKALMAALHDAIAARSDGTSMSGMQHEASLLATYVEG